MNRIAGYRAYLAPEAVEQPAAFGEAVALLGRKLTEVGRLLPPGPLSKLADTPFWLDWDDKRFPGLVYHPSADWLTANKYDPLMAGGVHIGNVRNFVEWTTLDQPMAVLHELAHAFHHKVLDHGHAGVTAAFREAVTAKKYESVAYVHGGKPRRAYALENEREYFAEITEAFFGRNDFYPFTRDELRTFDPAGYALLQSVWK